MGWLLTVLLLLGTACSYAQSATNKDIETVAEGWTPVKEQDGISVFRRSVPGQSIDEVRVLTTFTVPRERVMDLLGRVDRYEEWVYKCDKATLVNRLSKNEMIYYISINLPWPVTDRELVIHSKNWVEAGSGDIISESEASEKQYPVSEDHIRMGGFHSHWRISATAAGTTTIDYRVASDVGGSLPAWLINLGITTGPLHSMQRLKSLLTEGS